MITFDDIVLDKKEHTFFIPRPLRGRIERHLKKSGIPYQSINSDIRKIQTPVQKAMAEKFQKAGYIDTIIMDTIVSHVPNDVMFGKCCLFFGDTIDPDYRKKRTELDQKRNERVRQEIKDDEI